MQLSLPPRDVELVVLEGVVVVVGDVLGAVDHRLHPLLLQQVEVLGRPAVPDVDAAPAAADAALRRRVDEVERLVLLRVALEVGVDAQARPELPGLPVVVEDSAVAAGRLAVHLFQRARLLFLSVVVRV